MKKKKIITVLYTSILLSILIISVVVIINGPIFELNNNTLTYTLSYDTINVSTAKDLINNIGGNLTVVDCTGGCQPCSWKNGKIPGATWLEFPDSLHNTTNDILVYCKEGGSKSINFCERLIGHVYGEIYNLEGGYVAWTNF